MREFEVRVHDLLLAVWLLQDAFIYLSIIIEFQLFAMSSPVVAAAPSSKTKALSKGKIQKRSAQVITEPISVSKKRKPEPAKAKAEDLVTALKSKKLTKDEGTKKRVKHSNPSKTEETRQKMVIDGPKNAKRAARPAQKQRGPWKPSSPSPSPSLASDPEPPQSESDGGDPAEESSSEAEDVHLYGFSTDEDSSGDDLDAVDEGGDVDVGSLPTISRDDATVKRKLEKAKLKPVRVPLPSPEAALIECS
jgi:nucleolar protein 15